MTIWPSLCRWPRLIRCHIFSPLNNSRLCCQSLSRASDLGRKSASVVNNGPRARLQPHTCVGRELTSFLLIARTGVDWRWFAWLKEGGDGATQQIGASNGTEWLAAQLWSNTELEEDVFWKYHLLKALYLCICLLLRTQYVRIEQKSVIFRLPGL